VLVEATTLIAPPAFLSASSVVGRFSIEKQESSRLVVPYGVGAYRGPPSFSLQL
jgi:hypothetical protein